jgi:hypothetical protein
MKTSEVSVKSKKNELEYGWVEEKYRIVLHLGKMKNAVVIHPSFNGNFFKIGQSSFFPFNNEIYLEKFNSIEEAKIVASAYIMSWFSDTNFVLNLP